MTETVVYVVIDQGCPCCDPHPANGVIGVYRDYRMAQVIAEERHSKAMKDKAHERNVMEHRARDGFRFQAVPCKMNTTYGETT